MNTSELRDPNHIYAPYRVNTVSAVVMRVVLFIDRVNVDRVVRPMESAAEA
jgi:hypothetical protein